MIKSDLIITPETKVGTMLESYPQLEENLIAMSPSFKKLKNPILRKTVAKVDTLKQVAKVGNIPVAKLVNELRNAVGQKAVAVGELTTNNAETTPPWFDENKVVNTIDARPLIESGEQPMGPVFSALNRLEEDELLALITPFNPAPLIEKAHDKGYKSYTIEVEREKVLTYFLKA